MNRLCPILAPLALAPLALVAVVVLIGSHDPDFGFWLAPLGAAVVARMP